MVLSYTQVLGKVVYSPSSVDYRRVPLEEINI